MANYLEAQLNNLERLLETWQTITGLRRTIADVNKSLEEVVREVGIDTFNFAGLVSIHELDDLREHIADSLITVLVDIRRLKAMEPQREFRSTASFCFDPKMKMGPEDKVRIDYTDVGIDMITVNGNEVGYHLLSVGAREGEAYPGRMHFLKTEPLNTATGREAMKEQQAQYAGGYEPGRAYRVDEGGPIFKETPQDKEAREIAAREDCQRMCPYWGTAPEKPHELKEFLHAGRADLSSPLRNQFHHCWTDAKNSSTYNLDQWLKLRQLLKEQGIEV